MSQSENLVEFLARRWMAGTPADFGALALAVCVTLWFISRYWGD